MICTKFPYNKEVLLSELPEDLPDSGPSYNHKSSIPRFGGFLNFHFHRHIYPPELPQSKFSGYAKITFALVGLGVTAIAGYNYHRTADAAEVQAGLMTPQEYNQRHPKKQ